MKDINYYKTPKTPYKTRKDIKAEVFKGFEDFVGTQAQIDTRKKELEDEVNTQYREHQHQYNAEMAMLNEEFKRDLAEENGVVGNPKLDTLFSIAWDYGHSYGHGEVKIHFEKLVELID